MELQADGEPNNGRSVILRSSPKKSKPNKIPQRGLGIAALEKLRRDEQQRRIAASLSADHNINAISSTSATSAVAGKLVPGVFLDSLHPHPRSSAFFPPSLEPAPGLCCFSNYASRPHSDSGDVSAPLAWNSCPNENSINSNWRVPLRLRKPPEHLHQHQQEQQRSSLVMKNFLSPSSSSSTSLQMEPPSNQSYGSTSPPSLPDKQFASLKRSWPYPPIATVGHHGSSSTSADDRKRILLPRDNSSIPSSSRLHLRAEGGVSKLDGRLLGLRLLPVPEPISAQTIPFQKHQFQVRKNTDGRDSVAVSPPTFYNFMGLPHDVIGSSSSDAEAECRPVK